MYFSDYKRALLKYGVQNYGELVAQFPYGRIKTLTLTYLQWALETYFQ